ncbi:MAG: hypothetical protein QHC78_14365 [Pigmentiphaga sp.]|uniref:hypothetical protein n=1 Tax=Pigmentiphaga sp. TaxID=1977564 RepID=UPI00299FAD3B|nr:hypothetical protein [Pigmentiphaga sp.]MDX3906866.1 hypothetical protein [Pigmentiphaga sp.]
MRSLFVVLLLANLALFALDRGWFGQPLSERGREPARLRTEIRPDTLRVPPLPAKAESTTTAAVPPAPAPAPAAQAAPVIEAPPTAQAPAAQPPAQEPADGRSASVDGMASAPAGPPAAAAAPICLEWGVFSDAELPGARKWAGEHLPGARQEARREPGKQGWMVIVPPLPNAAAAQAAAAQLGKRGVNDFFVIQDGGPMQYAISLGVFSTENGAKKHAGDLQARGVAQAKVVPRSAQGGRNWLRLQGVAASGREVLDGARATFARQTVRDCQ